MNDFRGKLEYVEKSYYSECMECYRYSIDTVLCRKRIQSVSTCISEKHDLDIFLDDCAENIRIDFDHKEEKTFSNSINKMYKNEMKKLNGGKVIEKDFP